MAGIASYISMWVVRAFFLQVMAMEALASDQESGELRVPPELGTVYPHNVNASWALSTKADQIFTITFSRFDLEGSGSCRKDFVEIHDGQDDSAPSLAKFCGTNLPYEVRTTKGYAFIRFESNDSKDGNGFRLHWTAVRRYATDSPHQGSIRFPATGQYPEHFEFALITTTDPGDVVYARFLYIDISCDDFVAIRDGEYLSGKLLKKHTCGSTTRDMYSKRNSMLFHFYSNTTNPGTGFSMNWEQADEAPPAPPSHAGAQGLQPSLMRMVWLLLSVNMVSLVVAK